MAGHLMARVRCWFRGHTYALKFRTSGHGYPRPGYECTDCMHWTASPFDDGGVE